MVNNNTDGITVMHGNPKMAPIGPNDFNLNNNNFTVGSIVQKTTYQNNLSEDIVVVERSGLRQTIKPNNHTTYNKNFIVKTEFIIKLDAYKELELLFSDFDYVENNNILKQIKESYFMQIGNKNLSGMTITIIDTLNTEDFKVSNGNIYLSNSDIVVSTYSLLNAAAHPYSPTSISNDSFKDLNEHNNISFNIDVVDNSDSIGNRFILIAKEIHTLVPKKNIGKINGIYITKLEKDLTGKTKKIIKTTRYDFDKAEEALGIYKTKEECISGGDIKTLRKEELTKTEHINSISKLHIERELNELKSKSEKEIHELKSNNLKLEKEKIKLEEESRNRKEELSILEHEHELKLHKQQIEMQETIIKNKYLEAELERKRVEMKDFYEGRSYQRKDINDFLKWIPAILTGCLTIATLFIKLRVETK